MIDPAMRARALFSYNPETGAVLRRVTRGGQVAGARVGTRRRDGYLATKFDGAEILLHRLVWLHTYGVMPDGEIDHINGDKSDNRLGNLREVDRAMNNQNRRRAHVNNRLGVMGVTEVSGGVFLARIRVNKALIRLGRFSTPKLASEAYLAAKRRLHQGNTL